MADVIIPRLADYHISEKTGFLLEQSLSVLPSYFDAWNTVGQNVAGLLSQHRLRDAVQQMPLLDHERLQGHRQWRLAYTVLSFIGNGYIWQEGQTDPPKCVPRQLAVPWFAVCKHLGLRPSSCIANMVYSNWQLVDPTRPLSMDNIRSIFLYPGGSNCQRYFLTIAQIELNVVHGLQAMLRAKECIQRKDTEGVRQALRDIEDNIKELQADAARIHDGLDSDVFFHQIRPFLAGWGGAGSCRPDGIVFDGVSERPIQETGGSAAPCSIQCLDAALGITHEPEKHEFLDHMKTYMLPTHAQFIDALRQPPSIRDFVMRCHDDGVANGYERCVQALVEFRSYHLQIVTKYIIAKSTSSGSAAEFLKSIRGTTRLALLST